MDDIIQRYQRLLDIILAQVEAAQKSQWDSLEALTSEKKECLEQLVAIEESLAEGEKKPIHDAVVPMVQRIVSEDAQLNRILQERKNDLQIEMGRVNATQKNMGKISHVYGKKFSQNPSWNKEC